MRIGDLGREGQRRVGASADGDGGNVGRGDVARRHCDLVGIGRAESRGGKGPGVILGAELQRGGRGLHFGLLGIEGERRTAVAADLRAGVLRIGEPARGDRVVALRHDPGVQRELPRTDVGGFEHFERRELEVARREALHLAVLHRAVLHHGVGTHVIGRHGRELVGFHREAAAAAQYGDLAVLEIDRLGGRETDAPGEHVTHGAPGLAVEHGRRTGYFTGVERRHRGQRTVDFVAVGAGCRQQHAEHRKDIEIFLHRQIGFTGWISGKWASQCPRR